MSDSVAKKSALFGSSATDLANSASASAKRRSQARTLPRPASLASSTTAFCANSTARVVRLIGSPQCTHPRIDANSGNHLWSEPFDHGLKELFDVQDEVTRTMVATVAGRLEDAEIRTATAKRTESLPAYDPLLRGIQYLRATEQTTTALRGNCSSRPWDRGPRSPGKPQGRGCQNTARFPPVSGPQSRRYSGRPACRRPSTIRSIISALKGSAFLTFLIVSPGKCSRSLTKNVDDEAFLVDGPPEPAFLARDADDNLVEMPFVAEAAGGSATDLIGEMPSEFLRPVPDRLVADDDAARRQHVLDHARLSGKRK